MLEEARTAKEQTRAKRCQSRPLADQLRIANSPKWVGCPLRARGKAVSCEQVPHMSLHRNFLNKNVLVSHRERLAEDEQSESTETYPEEQLSDMVYLNNREGVGGRGGGEIWGIGERGREGEGGKGVKGEFGQRVAR